MYGRALTGAVAATLALALATAPSAGASGLPRLMPHYFAGPTGSETLALELNDSGNVPCERVLASGSHRPCEILGVGRLFKDMTARFGAGGLTGTDERGHWVGFNESGDEFDAYVAAFGGPIFLYANLHDSHPTDVADADFVVGLSVANGVLHGFLWRTSGDVIEDLGPGFLPYGVNDRGVIVGQTAGGRMAYFAHGKVHVLPEHGNLLSVNVDDAAVGRETVNGVNKPVEVDLGHHCPCSIRKLPLPHGWPGGSAIEVANNGAVVGDVLGPGGQTSRGVEWRAGHISIVEDLFPRASLNGGHVVTATGVNDVGAVTGGIAQGNTVDAYVASPGPADMIESLAEMIHKNVKGGRGRHIVGLLDDARALLTTPGTHCGKKPSQSHRRAKKASKLLRQARKAIVALGGHVTDVDVILGGESSVDEIIHAIGCK